MFHGEFPCSPKTVFFSRSTSLLRQLWDNLLLTSVEDKQEPEPRAFCEITGQEDMVIPKRQSIMGSYSECLKGGIMITVGNGIKVLKSVSLYNRYCWLMKHMKCLKSPAIKRTHWDLWSSALIHLCRHFHDYLISCTCTAECQNSIDILQCLNHLNSFLTFLDAQSMFRKYSQIRFLAITWYGGVHKWGYPQSSSI